MLPARWIVHNSSHTRRARPELHQLAVFLQVVEQRSFSGAARRLGCSQPAVSQTIRRLEDIYGGDLFARRQGAPLALTPIGKAVLPGARRILDAVDRQIAEATNAAQSGGGTLSVGFCPGLLGGCFRAGMAAFAAEAPLVRLRFMEGAPDILRAALDRHRLDMTVSPLPGMTNDECHESEFLWNEQLVAALPEKGRLSRQDGGGPPALHAVTPGIPCAMGDGDHGCARDGAGAERIDPQYEISPATVLDLVAMGLGMGIIPASAATPRPGVDFQPIDEGDAQIAIHARWFRNDANPIRHRLLRHLRAAASSVSRRASG